MGYPNSWMVYFMVNPNRKWMINRGTPMNWKPPYMFIFIYIPLFHDVKVMLNGHEWPWMAVFFYTCKCTGNPLEKPPENNWRSPCECRWMWINLRMLVAFIQLCYEKKPSSTLNHPIVATILMIISPMVWPNMDSTPQDPLLVCLPIIIGIYLNPVSVD